MSVNAASILGFVAVAVLMLIVLDMRVAKQKARCSARSSEAALLGVPVIAASAGAGGGAGGCAGGAGGANGCG